ncbi:MAG: N-acetylglucosamine-6-phosphate deacetylase [Spirosomataceae bacterium]
MQTIRTKRLFTGSSVLQNQEIKVQNGKIISVHRHNGPFTYDNLAPGFFDTHINGGYVHHFTHEPTLESLKDMYEASKASGAPFLLACLITSSLENIQKGIQAVRAFQVKYPTSGLLGMHLEGPFLSPKKRGAHLEKYLQIPTQEALDFIINEGKGVIQLLTIAPELFSPDQILTLRKAGFTLSIGHSNATYQEAAEAMQGGISLVTHLYNAMSGFGHREPGLVGATLTHPTVFAPIILDGYHCHFSAAKLAYEAKKESLFLVSDALFLGKKKERFVWEEFDATLTGEVYTNTEGNLAGGALSLGEMVKNAVDKVQIPLKTALEMATSRPARALGMEKSVGYIKPNFPAVFTAFPDDLSTFESILL